MDIIARFPRLPAEAVEGAVDRLGHARERSPAPATTREMSCRLRGGKSLVAVGRGGPMLLELSPTPSPTSSGSAPIRLSGKKGITRRPAFPGVSVVVLAVLAAAVWSLAAWNDNLRLARQQRPERLAARPVVSTQPGSP